jgi:hypothetical protein
MFSIFSSCPKCGHQVAGTFPSKCPNCTFDISALAGRGTTSFQVFKWNKHADLLQGRDIQLQSGEIYNASFDYNGQANLDDLVRFTITYGDRTTLPSARGSYQNPIILAYIPERIGAGTAIHFPGTVPCSGICLISPQSENYSHSFPVIDEWVQTTFAGTTSNCRICSSATSFGQPICAACYIKHGGGWRSFL